MTLPVIFAPKAAAWIRRETVYLRGERSPEAARRFRDHTQAVRLLLPEHPRAGGPGLIPGTRRFAKDDYIVSYRVRISRDTITAMEIFAVRHGRQSDAREPLE